MDGLGLTFSLAVLVVAVALYALHLTGGAGAVSSRGASLAEAAVSNTIVDLASARKALRITSLGHLRGNVERSRSYAMKAAHLADDQHAPALHRRLMAVIADLDEAYEAITQAHMRGEELK